MSNFREFKKDLNNTYDDIYEFIYDHEYKLGQKLIEDNDDNHYDSYGNEDSTLSRIYQLPNHGDIFVKFDGNRSSYNGEEWEDPKEVVIAEKVINTWSTVEQEPDPEPELPEILNAEQILKILNENIDYPEFAYGDFDSEELGLGPVKEVAQRGGEGEGTTWYSVKYFEKHDVYIRIDGYYTSYDGTYFEDGMGKEVFPGQKTITVYE